MIRINNNYKQKEEIMNLQTIKQFININGLTITSDYADSNPNMANSDKMNHYKVTIKRKFKLITKPQASCANRFFIKEVIERFIHY